MKELLKEFEAKIGREIFQENFNIITEFVKEHSDKSFDNESLSEKIGNMADNVNSHSSSTVHSVVKSENIEVIGFIFNTPTKRYGIFISKKNLSHRPFVQKYPFGNGYYGYFYERAKKPVNAVKQQDSIDNVLKELGSSTLTYAYNQIYMEPAISDFFGKHGFEGEEVNEGLKAHFSDIQEYIQNAEAIYKCYRPGSDGDAITGFVWLTETKNIGIILSDKDLPYRPYLHQYSFKGAYVYIYEEELQKKYVIVSPQERNIFDTYGEARYRANRMAENNRDKLFRIAEIKTECFKEDVLNNAEDDYRYGYGKNIPLTSPHREVQYTLSDAINKFLIRGDLKINDFFMKIVAKDAFFGDADLLIYLDIETWPEHSENQSLYVQWKGWVTIHKTINGKLLWGRWYDKDSGDWFEDQREKNMTIFPGYLEKEYESILSVGTARYTGSRGDFVDDKIEINLTKELDPKAPEGNQLCRVIDRLISRHAIKAMTDEQTIESNTFDVLEGEDHIKAIHGLDLTKATSATKLTTDDAYHHPSEVVNLDDVEQGIGYDLVNLYDFEIPEETDKEDKETLDTFCVQFKKDTVFKFEKNINNDNMYTCYSRDLLVIIGKETEFHIFFFSKKDLQEALTQ